MKFGEDLSQARKNNLPQVMAALRNCVINLLRLHNFPSIIPDGFDFFAHIPSMFLQRLVAEIAALGKP